jgi:hypothetical protein
MLPSPRSNPKRFRLFINPAARHGGSARFAEFWALVGYTRAAGSLVACVLVLLLSGAPARAAVTHLFLPGPSKTLSEGVPASSGAAVTGGLQFVNAMTIDPGETVGEAGHLWVAEQLGSRAEQSRVDEFDPASGHFEAQLGQTAVISNGLNSIALGHATGEREIYVGSLGGHLAVFGPSGVLQSTWDGSDAPGGGFSNNFGQVSGVAVDGSAGVLGDWASGDVYVVNPAAGNVVKSGPVDVFKPLAGGGEEYRAQLTGTCPSPGVCPGEEVPFVYPQHVTVDSATGEVLVVDETAAQVNVVDIFKPGVIPGEYEFVRSLTGPPNRSFAAVSAVATDGSTGDIYVAQQIPAALYQFSSDGGFLGLLTGTPAGRFAALRSVAVDPETHDVYLGDTPPGGTAEGKIDVFGDSVVIPDVMTGAASEVAPASATLNGSVNPLEAETHEGATCQFAWGLSEAFGNTAPCPEALTGNAALPVNVTLTNLQPDTKYFYRLQAGNQNGINAGEGTEAQCEGEPAEDGCFTTTGVGIRSESVTEVAATSVTFNATIDPDHAVTHFHFQYGTSSSYTGETSGGLVGSQKGDVEVSRHLQGLAPGTEYHYRVVAVSEPEPGRFETFLGPDHTFITQAAGGLVLPDSRKWEMVSPPSKQGALLGTITNAGVLQASVDGSSVTYLASSPTEAQPQGNVLQVQVLSARGNQGWQSRDIVPPHAGGSGASIGLGGEYRFFSADLSQAVVQPFGAFIPSTSPFALSPAEASEQTAFLRSDFPAGNPNALCPTPQQLEAHESCYRPLVTGKQGFANVPPETAFGQTGTHGGTCPPELLCGPQFAGGTPDLAHLLLGSSAALTALAAAPGTQGELLYEWSSGKAAGEALQPVSVLPESEQNGETIISGGLRNNPRDAVSRDGSRVVWYGGEHLYLRDLAAKQTIRLDEAPSGVAVGGPFPRFQAADVTGKKVFFTDTQPLTSQSGGGGGENTGADLYECEVREVSAGALGCPPNDLTPRGATGEHAAVLGSMLGASEDGAWAYFVANGVLENGGVPVAGAVHGTCSSPPTSNASCNLYVRHGGTTSLVAVLSNEDSPDWARFSPNRNKQTARVSPDGHWLAFMSERQLTGYDNRDAVSGRPDQEVYLYDAQAGRLTCASCDPTGARPYDTLEKSGSAGLLGDGPSIWSGHSLAANIPGWTPYEVGTALYQSRYLSDDGRLFFNSYDGLVPQDVNQTSDVYEYEPEGVGSQNARCGLGSAGGGDVFRPTRAYEVDGRNGEEGSGCVALISSGTSSQESAFIDASETGGDVFFLTAGKLAPQDVDASLDVYDAHECTAARPCLSPGATTPPPCVTEASCKAAPTPQPSIFGPAASATFSGAGNFPPASPPKPKTARRLAAERLAKALTACRKDRQRRKRLACDRRARHRYGAKQSRPSSKSHRGGK